VSENDNAIPPDAERFMAERMGATTKSLAGSHTVLVAQPVAVAEFIAEALHDVELIRPDEEASR
jgi:hypothetical protein